MPSPPIYLFCIKHKYLLLFNLLSFIYIALPVRICDYEVLQDHETGMRLYYASIYFFSLCFIFFIYS